VAFRTVLELNEEFIPQPWMRHFLDLKLLS
jgi:hypothetical protein